MILDLSITETKLQGFFQRDRYHHLQFQDKKPHKDWTFFLPSQESFYMAVAAIVSILGVLSPSWTVVIQN